MHDPSGPISLAMENLRSLVAGSATFQAWVNAADATQAKDNVHLVALPLPEDKESYTLEEIQAERPFVIIGLPEDKNAFNSSRVGELAYQHSGRLVIYLEANVPEEIARDPGTVEVWFLNQIGAVISEMQDLSGGAGYLTVHDFNCSAPQRSGEEELSTGGDFMAILVEIEWGV